MELKTLQYQDRKHDFKLSSDWMKLKPLQGMTEFKYKTLTFAKADAVNQQHSD